MVATEYLSMNSGIVETLEQTIGDHEIVDTPAGILLAGLETVGPPGVFHLFRILIAEGICEATGQQVAELLTLLIGEAGIAAISLGVLDIYLLMGHIEVATEDNGLHGVELFQITAERVFPRHAILQATEAILRVGRIAADEEEVGHLERDDAALVIVEVDAYAIGDGEGLMTGEDGGTTIAFLLGGVPERLVAVEGEVELPGLHLRLLETEEVGIELTENITEALALAGTETVHIPRNQFHILKLLINWLQRYKKIVN